MAVEIKASYHGVLRCEALHGPSGAALQTDAPTDNGGQGASFSPTDLVATALGTCVLTIVGLVAERHGLDLRGASVEVTKEMVNQPLRRIGSLRTIVTIPGGAIEDSAMRQRIENAARQCPVHQSLHHEIEIPIEFRYED
jgi:putative redox protein